MHGNGNDFIVIDALNQKITLSKESIQQLGNRYTGIGFDQCLLIEPARDNQYDFIYRIFNNDGEEVAQCGNGARAVARFLKHKNLTTKNTIKLKTLNKIISVTINNDNSVTVNMGLPEFNPANIPLNTQDGENVCKITYKNQEIEFIAVNVGNPHAIILTKDVTQENVSELGAMLSNHQLFPERTNVGFMQIVTENHIKLRVYERGAGETKACGSGAVGAVAVGIFYKKLTSPVKVSMPGGDVFVSWDNQNQDIKLRGFAEFVYDGVLSIDKL